MGRNLERPFKNMAKKPEDMFLDTATPEAGEEQVMSVENLQRRYDVLKPLKIAATKKKCRGTEKGRR
jgi:hypothetical protein